jgi:hypothetical protein
MKTISLLLTSLALTLPGTAVFGQTKPVAKPATKAADEPKAPAGDLASYASVKTLCEELPRKPKRGDNKLAQEESNQWIKDNVVGRATLRVSGKVSSVGRSTLRSKGKEDKPQFTITLSPSKLTWRNYEFSVGATTTFNEEAVDRLARIPIGTDVKIDGTVQQMTISWETKVNSGRTQSIVAQGRINLALNDCELTMVKSNAAIRKGSRD